MYGAPATRPPQLSGEQMHAIAERAAMRNGASLLWWILGVSLGSIPLAAIAVTGIGAIVVATQAPAVSPSERTSAALFAFLPTLGVLAVMLIALVGLIQIAIHTHRMLTRNGVLRMLREGTPHVGRIVQARRISMTQSRVSVQGATFAPFDAVLVTAMADAALHGREVTVYTRPGEPPMTLPLD